MGIYTGKYAVVDGVSTLRNWSISAPQDVKGYVASNTRSGTGRRKGNSDWTGSYGAYGAVPVFMPGQAGAFSGYAANDKIYGGDIVVDSVNINWNYESADPLAHVVNFGGDGALEQSSGSLEDASFPDVPEIVGLPFEIMLAGGSASWEPVCVTQVGLSLSMPSKSYVNSCTDGWTGRLPGAALDWSASLTTQNEDFESLPFGRGDLIGLRLYTTDSEYYELLWGIVGGFTNFNVNRETGEIISMTIPISMAGFDHDEEEVGHILLPDGSTYWPEEGS